MHHHRGHEAHNAPAARIVCSLELSDEAVPLLRFTKELADTMGAQVRLIHVVANDTAAGQEIAKLQEAAGTDFPVTTPEGPVASDIAEFAEDQQADLIVIGRGKARARVGLAADTRL